MYVFRDDLYWVVVVRPGSLTHQCGHLLVTESLGQLHRVCSGLCGILTQHSITANATLIAEIVQETMVMNDSNNIDSTISVTFNDLQLIMFCRSSQQYVVIFIH